MNSNQNFSNEKTDNSLDKYDVDIKQLFFLLLRNKKLISIFGVLGLFISGFYAFHTKRVWQGEFRIVLEGAKVSQSITQRISNIAGLRPGINTLETEVGILKSPSVLMNIFEFVKTKKELKSNSSMQGLRFRNWQKNSLDIGLEKGTSILSLSYRDNDKELILPVLNRISLAYQDYSGRKRLRAIELGINYFEDQIAKFKIKSIESLRKAQKFAIDNDLSVLGNESKADLDITNYIPVEVIRVKAANQIRIIDQRLEQIYNLKDKYDEQIIYTASTIPELIDLSNRLKRIDTELARLALIYKENDISIQKLVKERIFLIDLLKKQVTGFLIARKADAQARLKSSERPEGVLIEYKMLVSNSNKDKSTLDKLENQYRELLLENARNKDPWKLITKPTLLPSPVAPNRKKMLAFGLLSGIFLGSGVSLISEKKKNIVYSLSELEGLGKWPFLVELCASKKSNWTEDLDLIVSGQLLDKDGSIALIAIGEINDSLLQEIHQIFNKLLPNCELIVTKDLIKAKRCTNFILLTALGITKRQEVVDKSKKLLLQKKSVLGLLTLNNINLRI